jgi:hypothetical protein
LSDIDYGPQAEAVQAIEERFKTLTKDEKQQMYDLRDDAFWAAWNVVVVGRAYRAGLGAARVALRDHLFDFNGGVTAYGAALAVLLRHTIGVDGFEQAHYDALTDPWVTVTGMLAHPDDTAAPVDTLPDPTEVADELDALGNAIDAIGSLGLGARRRVLTYLNDRFA